MHVHVQKLRAATAGSHLWVGCDVVEVGPRVAALAGVVDGHDALAVAVACSGSEITWFNASVLPS